MPKQKKTGNTTTPEGFAQTVAATSAGVAEQVAQAEKTDLLVRVYDSLFGIKKKGAAAESGNDASKLSDADPKDLGALGNMKQLTDKLRAKGERSNPQATQGGRVSKTRPGIITDMIYHGQRKIDGQKGRGQSSEVSAHKQGPELGFLGNAQQITNSLKEQREDQPNATQDTEKPEEKSFLSRLYDYVINWFNSFSFGSAQKEPQERGFLGNAQAFKKQVEEEANQDEQSKRPWPGLSTQAPKNPTRTPNAKSPAGQEGQGATPKKIFGIF
ncbi:MAG: hypothetical protein SFT93_02325 [Rickettsiaceae bacterium]|nr:hypothetical protein [Rickettsiaceae bacterium]